MVRPIEATQSREGQGFALALARAPGPAVSVAPAEGGVGGTGSGVGGDLDSDLDLESVYRHHAARVSRWAARLGGPGLDVEDIVHDVFLVVERRLGEFRGDAQISTWLYEITVRVVQGRRRRSRRLRWLLPFSWRNADDAASDPQAAISDDRPSPLDGIERREAAVLLYRLLDGLDEKYRTAVVLFELEGLSCQEIAEITGTSISNVWARLSRGREKLIEAFARSEAKERT